jgi:hypothetical protein
MGGSRRLMVFLAVTAFVVAPVVVWAASQTDRPAGKRATLDYRSVEGVVIAVDLNSKTIRVTATEGSATGAVSAAFTDRTIIREGIVRTRPTDLKVGEHVAMLYSGSADRWVADDINILESPVAVAPFLGNDMRSSHN